MGNCVFCEILAGSLPASIIYRDDVCVAFMDTNPINPGHVLVIPVDHAQGLAILGSCSGQAMFSLAHRIAIALRGGALAAVGVRCEGANLLLSDGSAAGQVVGHVHLHVVPRFGGDGAGFRRGDRGPDRSSRVTLDVHAGGLERALAPASRRGGSR